MSSLLDKFRDDEVEWFTWAVEHNYSWSPRTMEPLDELAARLLGAGSLDQVPPLLCDKYRHRWSLTDERWKYLWRPQDTPPLSVRRITELEEATDDMVQETVLRVVRDESEEGMVENFGPADISSQSESSKFPTRRDTPTQGITPTISSQQRVHPSRRRRYSSRHASVYKEAPYARNI